MNELTLDGKIYVSSKRAAEMTGYAKDYVGQLCREGRVAARLVGRNWYVLEESIREHRFGPQEAPTPTNVAVLDSNAAENTDWEPSRYNPVATDELPIIVTPIISGGIQEIAPVQP